MEFMEKLQKQKDDAKAAYIKARDEWADTRTAENIKGDPEKWRALCDRKMDCYYLSKVQAVQCSGGIAPGLLLSICRGVQHARGFSGVLWIFWLYLLPQSSRGAH